MPRVQYTVHFSWTEAHTTGRRQEQERVDKENPTQFGRAMRELGVVMIPGYSPEARRRSERMFETFCV